MLDDCYLDASKVQKFSEEQSKVPMDLQIRPTEASLHFLEFLFQITLLDKLVDVGRIDAHRIAAIVVIKIVVVGGTKKLNERIVINNHLLPLVSTKNLDGLNLNV